MNKEIKKRIEQIRHGKVPKGYKKTKGGVVPNEWEETLLSQYLTVNNNKNNNLKYGKDDMFSISGELGIVNQIELLGRSYAGASLASYGVVYPNDIVYTKSPLKANPYGIIKTNKTGKIGLVSTLYAIFHCKPNVFPNFVQLYFESRQNLNNYLYPIVNIGAKHDMKISDKNSLKGYVVFPPFPEQKKIAEILSTQDKLIELTQRKIEELKKLKEYYLRKMFPQKGSNVPEIRFKGFTDDWEQRKLGEISSSCSGGTPTVGVKEYYGGKIPFIRSAEINSECTELFITEEGLKNSSARLVSEGDILYALYGATSGEVSRARIKGAINQAILVIKPMPDYDPEYIVQWLQKSKQSITETYLQGGQGNLSGAIVKELMIEFPSLEEQQTIGEYFHNLDHLITLHQHKCEELKKQKKSLMQLLLTGIVRVKT